MAFHFKKKESVRKAIRRIGSERIEDALDCLKDCHRADAVHCARKDIKKVRAVLQLVRASLRKKEFARLKKLLREPARRLGSPRDAYVQAKTLTKLKHEFKGQLAPGALRHIRLETRKRLDKELKRFTKEKAVKVIARGLRRSTRQLGDIKVRDEEWKAIGPGFKAAYARGMAAYQKVLKDSSPENFHGWRKRVKELWYQVTLLSQVWPEQIEAMAGELEMLGEHLGDDHDLSMLQSAANEKCAQENHSHELETLNGLIQERQRELRAAAFAIGERFYVEKPADFCRRLAGYWKIWRREKKPATFPGATL